MKKTRAFLTIAWTAVALAACTPTITSLDGDPPPAPVCGPDDDPEVVFCTKPTSNS